MAKNRSNIGFTLMAAIGLPIRNMFMPPQKIWAEVEINPGAHVLDFGCRAHYGKFD